MAFKETNYWDNGSGPYCGIFRHSFIRRLCVRWNKRNHTDLPYALTVMCVLHPILNVLEEKAMEKTTDRHKKPAACINCWCSKERINETVLFSTYTICVTNKHLRLRSVASGLCLQVINTMRGSRKFFPKGSNFFSVHS